MSSVGKFTNSVFHLAQENQASLINVNLDFSLLKFDAPPEFRRLGECLSRKRRDEAEAGVYHSTARKLGALFSSEIPHVPALIEAYGKRASEIAETPGANPVGSTIHGAFAEHVGADGTTIWATATSGKSVVTMHLLACILARIWQREQAVSIWDQLVQRRKAELAQRISTVETVHASDLGASLITIERKQLDAWDASARAWLQTADTAKEREQSQIRWVLSNMSLPVSIDKPETEDEMYASVLSVWVRAMSVMNDLILGRPQRIQSGDVLLGLLSWHLYPDIAVLGVDDKLHHISQRDEFVLEGGIVTIGMQARGSGPDADDGIFWSLPLAHMRYYGNPVTVKRRLGTKESDVSFPEFRYVIFGSIISTWDTPEDDLETPMRIILLLAGALDAHPERPHWDQKKTSLNWLKSLALCCKDFEQSNDLERKRRKALVEYGKRRCGDFLAPQTSHPLPVFDLTHMGFLVDTATSKSDQPTQSRIEFLRRYARISSRRHELRDAVIRYRPESKPRETYHSMPEYLCTSVFRPRSEQEVTSKKRKRSEHGRQQHYQWNSGTRIDDVDEPRYYSNNSLSDIPGFRPVPGLQEQGVTSFPSGPGKVNTKYRFICGDEQRAALFIPQGLSAAPRFTTNAMSVVELLRCLEKGYISPFPLLEKLLYFVQFPGHHSEYFKSLEILYRVEEIYSGLDGATVNLELTSNPISQSHCAELFRKEREEGQSFSPLALELSCIAYFQTGNYSLDPLKLNTVLAMSYKNSIFVASQLLEDPLTAISSNHVRRLTGNVGRPGIALLFPPENPRTLARDSSLWNIEHEQFDGELLDSFSATSLHLSFTGYEIPINVGPHGGREAEVTLTEIAISVFDRGRWIGDLDISRAEKQWIKNASCDHSPEERNNRSHLPDNMRSIDSWDAFLDAPAGVGVLRAHGNPMARLAAATLAAQKSYSYHVLPSNGCWACVDPMIFPRVPLYSGAGGTQTYDDSTSSSAGSMSDDDESDGSISNEFFSDEDSESEVQVPPDGFEDMSIPTSGLNHTENPYVEPLFPTSTSGLNDTHDSAITNLFPAFQHLEQTFSPPSYGRFQTDVIFIC